MQLRNDSDKDFQMSPPVDETVTTWSSAQLRLALGSGDSWTCVRV